MCTAPSGSWGGWCLSMAPYVTVMGPMDGATAPPEGAHVAERHPNRGREEVRRHAA